MSTSEFCDVIVNINMVIQRVLSSEMRRTKKANVFFLLTMDDSQMRNEGCTRRETCKNICMMNFLENYIGTESFLKYLFDFFSTCNFTIFLKTFNTKTLRMSFEIATHAP